MNIYFKRKNNYSFGESIYISYLKMAGAYHTEQQRIIDRNRCIAFREACDAGASFINR